MKKSISTIVAIGFISSMLVNTAYADNRHLEVLNPLWVPVAIFSTVAATVAAIAQPPVVYERRGYPEPPQAVIYSEPRNYRYERHFDRYEEPGNYRQIRHYNHGRSYDEPRYREYR